MTEITFDPFATGFSYCPQQGIIIGSLPAWYRTGEEFSLFAYPWYPPNETNRRFPVKLEDD
jgi:hypothetical protein